jgi:anti-sigma factor RsiW
MPANQLTCEQCRELLSDYVDRELTGAERASVEHHLGNCPKCGTESARMLGLKKIVQHWEGVKGSGAFHKSLMNKMIRESQQMPVLDTAEAQAVSSSAVGSQDGAEDAEAGKRLPPIWVVLAFVCLAFAAYYLVLWLRGL